MSTLPEQRTSPPSEAWNRGEEKRQSKISKLTDYYQEVLAAIESLGEAQASINYADPGRFWVSALDMAYLWEIRGKLGKLRQHLRDKLETQGIELED